MHRTGNDCACSYRQTLDNAFCSARSTILPDARSVHSSAFIFRKAAPRLLVPPMRRLIDTVSIDTAVYSETGAILYVVGGHGIAHSQRIPSLVGSSSLLFPSSAL